jgi:lipopolysaccharide transport system ATP-binding protein
VEIKSKFKEIVAFAEIEKFLDTPVKRYSSGMYVRLAFAVAANLNPEILIVDEVLAVGDMAFQKKCLGKMNEVGRGGRTVLFVSHNLAAVENLCQRGIVLESGQLTFDGPSKDAVRHYLAQASARLGESGGHIVEFEGVGERKPYLGKFLKRAELFTEDDQPVREGLPMGAPLKVKVYFDLPRPTESFNMGLGFDNMFGQRIFTAHSCFEPDRSHGARVGAQIFTCDIPSFTLAPGDYTTSLWLDIGNAHADEVNDAVRVSVIKSDYYGTGKVPWNGAFVLPHHWQLDEVDEAVSASQAAL